MNEFEIIHIALAPPRAATSELIENIAEIIGKGIYDTGLLISGEIPRIIAHYTDIAVAQQVVEKLKGLGLTVLAIGDSELRRSVQVFNAYKLEFQGKEIAFADSCGNKKVMGQDDVFLIMAGRMPSEVELEKKEISSKLDITATMLTGGIPVLRKKEEKHTTSSTQTEHFIRIYGRDYSCICIQLLQHLVDYSFLRGVIEVSSLKNLRATAAALCTQFPQGIYDDRLELPFAAPVFRQGPSTDFEIRCRLIHAFHVLTA